MQNYKEKKKVKARFLFLVFLAIVCVVSLLITGYVFSKVGFMTSPRVWGVLYQENLKYGQFISIDHVLINDKDKEVKLIYVSNNSGCTIQDYDGIRETFNNYLKTHHESFMHDGYSIALEINGTKAGGPCIVEFSNIIENEADHILLYDELSDMTITQEAIKCNRISLITGCDTLRSLHLSNVELDDLEALKRLPSLEYIDLSFGYTKEDVLTVKAALPNCEVN